jgi:predicted nuclease of predicted toxin-antitoxin system
MQFLIDMNLSPRLADLLVNADHQAVYWGTIGRPDAEDSEILAWAKNNDHVLLTNDLDFGTILATRGLKSPSVIQFRRRDVLPETIIPFILRATEKFSSDLLAGALIVVDERRYRVRLLPLTNVSIFS